MTQLSADRDTPLRIGSHVSDPVAGSTLIYAGALVVLNSNGYAAPGSETTGLTARGRAEHRADNSDGADGDRSVEVRRGVFRFANSGSDPVERNHIGGDAYIVDDQTVAATDGSGSRSAAGRVVDLDGTGVWVEIG